MIHQIEMLVIWFGPSSLPWGYKASQHSDGIWSQFSFLIFSLEEECSLFPNNQAEKLVTILLTLQKAKTEEWCYGFILSLSLLLLM